MNTIARLVTSLIAILGTLMLACSARAADAEKPSPANAKIKVVILVGGHGFDQAGFDKFWSGYDDIDSHIWKGSPYSVFDDVSQFKDDVIVMYNLSDGMTEKQKQNFLTLLERGTGLVVWHHALADCQDWPEFEKIAGAKFWLKPGQRGGVQVPGSGTGFGKVKMHIADPDHPITKGMSDFEVTDEPYHHQTFCEGIRVLVSTDHPQSDKAIAWVHQFGKARVFGYQSGHDAQAWTNDGFRRVMGQGIRWAGGRLPGAEKK
jgi:type 1 glutamine amidotransferase